MPQPVPDGATKGTRHETTYTHRPDGRSSRRGPVRCRTRVQLPRPHRPRPARGLQHQGRRLRGAGARHRGTGWSGTGGRDSRHGRGLAYPHQRSPGAAGAGGRQLLLQDRDQAPAGGRRRRDALRRPHPMARAGDVQCGLHRRAGALRRLRRQGGGLRAGDGGRRRGRGRGAAPFPGHLPGLRRDHLPGAGDRPAGGGEGRGGRGRPGFGAGRRGAVRRFRSRGVGRGLPGRLRHRRQPCCRRATM